MAFLRNLLAAILGSLIALGIFFVMFFIFITLVGSAGEGVSVKEDTILELRLNEPVYDYLGTDENDPFVGVFDEGLGLDQILHSIRVAQTDDRIKGISIKNNFSRTGLAQTQELREALAAFKASGKLVYAFSDFFSQKDYYLASVADKVFLHPQGLMDFKGLASEVLYFKELQEKTGIRMEVIRHGKYKSAVEPFLSDSMSEENRTQIKALLSSIWEVLLKDIGTSRDIAVTELNRIADTLGARTPELAVASGLLDGTLYWDEYEEQLKTAMGWEADAKLNYLSLMEYAKVAQGKNTPGGKDRIAVIYAQGEILYGEGDREFIGQGMLQRELKKARDNENVKAVVLRVNSPGGSSLVSDIIWREVKLTKAEKPVVVSFGNVAASGGYYLAVAADRIYAEPTTVTGSIGVFGTIPNINEFAGEIGINAEQVGTNANAVDYSFFEPMSDAFRQQMEEGIADTYTAFLERVAEGRDMSVEAVNEIAQGRVWSGITAKEIGLVDELGSLDAAIKAAAELAGLSSYSIRKYPKYKSNFERFMDNLSTTKLKIGEEVVKKELGEATYEQLKVLKSMTEQSGIQARMPYNLNIK